jgi:hypothetical protein
MGVDAGLQYRWHQWQTGLVLRDVTTSFTFWTFDRQALDDIAAAVPGHNQTPPADTEIRLPSLRLGIGREWKPTANYGLRAEMDWTVWFYERHALWHTGHFSWEPGLGLSASYRNKVFLRLGADNIYRRETYNGRRWTLGPHAGLGVRLKYLQLDYAFTNWGLTGRYSHIFSLMLDLKIFGKKR